VAWLSLDPGDNDPARFWRHTVAALDRARPGTADRVAPLLGPPALPSFEGLVTTVVNEFTTKPDEAVLVLDDYHLIDAQPVHASLAFLLEHLPPGLHLVLASRSDPPLPLARLRAGRQLAELRVGDLRFTGDEAAALPREATGRRPARRGGGGAGVWHRGVGGRAVVGRPVTTGAGGYGRVRGSVQRNVPRLQSEFVARPRLVARLDKRACARARPGVPRPVRLVDPSGQRLSFQQEHRTG
jgi:LuxR family maltose regulon positive regulatory protein